MRNAHKILVGEPEKRDNFGDLSVDGRVLQKCILNKQGLRVWAGFDCISIEPSGSLLRTRLEPTGSIKRRWGGGGIN
jgi:hypothetical protein